MHAILMVFLVMVANHDAHASSHWTDSSSQKGLRQQYLITEEMTETDGNHRRYIVELAAHHPGNTSDVEDSVETLEGLLGELEPYVVSVKSFHVPRTSLSQPDEFISDVSIWKSRLLELDKTTMSQLPRGSRKVNSAIWAWRTIQYLQRERDDNLIGSCHTLGWKNSSVCQSSSNDTRDLSLGNMELHVGFSLAIEDINAIKGADPRQSFGKTGNPGTWKSRSNTVFLLVDLDVDLARKLRKIHGIYAIEENKEVQSVEETCSVKDRCSKTSQTNDVWWNLGRVDSRDSPDDSYSWSSCDAGSGSFVFVLDTGIRVSHTEFEDRAFLGINAFFLNANSWDDEGHGTHVAGTIAGKTFGVAKRANVVAVKVLDSQGTGNLQSIFIGLQWTELVAMDFHIDDLIHRRRLRRSVINLSLGSDLSTTINRMVERLTDLGVVSVVAAGNEDKDACTVSPASHFRSITVGASTKDDTKASFSNFGPCVDVFAPGTEIKSAFIGGDNDFAVFQGTSMAAPLVAGLVARHLELYPFATPDEVSASISCSATGQLFGGQYRENGVFDLSDDLRTSSLLSFYPEECSLNVSFRVDSPDRVNASDMMELVYWPVRREKLSPDFRWPIKGVYGSSEDESETCVGRLCWSECNKVGKCWNGHCNCPCHRVGLECEHELKIHNLKGLNGSLLASNIEKKNDDGKYEAYDVFGFESPDWWFFIPVDSRTKSIALTTCSNETDFRTVMYMLSTCPHFSSTPYVVETAHSEDCECDYGEEAATVSVSMDDGPLMVEDELGRKGLFGMIEGMERDEGTFRLSWEISTYGADVSSSPTRDPDLPRIQRISMTSTSSSTSSWSPTSSESSSVTKSGTNTAASITPSQSLTASMSGTATSNPSGTPSVSVTPSLSVISSATTSNSPSVSSTGSSSCSVTSRFSGTMTPSSSAMMTASPFQTQSTSSRVSSSTTQKKVASDSSSSSSTITLAEAAEISGFSPSNYLMIQSEGAKESITQSTAAAGEYMEYSMRFSLRPKNSSSEDRLREVSNKIVDLLEMADGIDKFYPSFGRQSRDLQWKFTLEWYNFLQPLQNFHHDIMSADLEVDVMVSAIATDSKRNNEMMNEDQIDKLKRRSYDALFPESTDSFRPGLRTSLSSMGYDDVKMVKMDSEDLPTFLERTSRFRYNSSSSEENASSDQASNRNEEVIILVATIIPVTIGLIVLIVWRIRLQRRRSIRERHRVNAWQIGEWRLEENPPVDFMVKNKMSVSPEAKDGPPHLDLVHDRVTHFRHPHPKRHRKADLMTRLKTKTK